MMFKSISIAIVLYAALNNQNAPQKIDIRSMSVTSWHSTLSVLNNVKENLVQIERSIESEGYELASSVEITHGEEMLAGYKKEKEVWFVRGKENPDAPNAICLRLDPKNMHIIYVFSISEKNVEVESKRKRSETLENIKSRISGVVKEIVTK